MTKQKQVYKCSICGNIVEILHEGASSLVCCDKPMKLLKENDTDAATEKHVPVLEKTDRGYRVTVGENPHPMEDSHYIEWIELIADGRIFRQHLKPGDPPVAEFCIEAQDITAREHCNLHGLWRNSH